MSALPKLKHDYIVGVEIIASSEVKSMIEGQLKININTQDGKISQSFSGELTDDNQWVWSSSTMGTAPVNKYFVYI